MSDDTDKPKKGMLSKAFGIATKVALWSFPLAVAASLVFDPTWLMIFHNEQNIMAQAWIEKVTPYTNWLPYHLGLTNEDGGLLSGVMRDFLADELAAQHAIGGSVNEAITPDATNISDIPIPGLG